MVLWLAKKEFSCRTIVKIPGLTIPPISCLSLLEEIYHSSVAHHKVSSSFVLTNLVWEHLFVTISACSLNGWVLSCLSLCEWLCWKLLSQFGFVQSASIHKPDVTHWQGRNVIISGEGHLDLQVGCCSEDTKATCSSFTRPYMKKRGLNISQLSKSISKSNKALYKNSVKLVENIHQSNLE